MVEHYDHDAPDTRRRRRLMMVVFPLLPMALMADEIAGSVSAVRSDAPDAADVVLQTAAQAALWLIMLVVVFSSRPIARNDPPFVWTVVSGAALGPLVAYTFASHVGPIVGSGIGLLLLSLWVFAGWRSHLARLHEHNPVSA